MAARQMFTRAGAAVAGSIAAGVASEQPSVVAQPISPVLAEFENDNLEQTAQLIFTPASEVIEVEYPDSVCCLNNFQRNVQRMSIELSRDTVFQKSVRDVIFNNGGPAALRTIDSAHLSSITNSVQEGRCFDIDEDNFTEEDEDEMSSMSKLVIAGAVILLIGACATYYLTPAVAQVAVSGLSRAWAQILTTFVRVGAGAGGGAAAGAGTSSTATSTAAAAATTVGGGSLLSSAWSWVTMLGTSTVAFFVAKGGSKYNA